MTNRVIAFVCLLGMSGLGVLAQAQDFDYKQPTDFYRGKKGGQNNSTGTSAVSINNEYLKLGPIWVAEIVKATAGGHFHR